VFILIGIAEAVRLRQPDVALSGAEILTKVLESWIDHRETTPDVKTAAVDLADITDDQFEKIPEGRFYKA
jgi:hypothetical protein